MKRNQIIDNSIQHFQELTSWKITLKEYAGSIDDMDGSVTLSHPKTKEKLSLFINIKNEIRNNDILKLTEQKKKHSDILLLAQYISKPNREILRNQNINYLESSGNCYIQKGSIFIYINDQKVFAQRQTSNSKIYTESGMRFIYSLFLEPDLLNNTYRDIAAKAEIALGNVGAIIEALEKESFIQVKNKIRVIKNKEQLFNIWANDFNTTQRPHLFQRRMSFADKNMLRNWKSIELHDAYWGGEPAANLLDKHLTPENFVMYSHLTMHQLMKTYKLIPDDINGNILYMLPPFKNKELPKIADPFIIYAELIESKDSRCLEAAKRIKEKYIDPTF
jgi:hypothetical protein